jgi:uncharacterized membrane-anchored protein YhcB (DUF1043 family)
MAELNVFTQMIETIMYIGIGLLAGCLIGVAVIPLVHDRAVRLTARRLEAALPRSIADIEADKDLLRAEFAMSARRLEIIVEQHKNKITSQLVDLSRKSDAINRLNIDRDGLKVEAIGLRMQVEALKKRLPAPDKEAKPPITVVTEDGSASQRRGTHEHGRYH